MSVCGFDPQPVLKGRGLVLRPLTSEDREALYAAASDPLIWEQHPAKTRHQRAVFDPYFDFLLSTGEALAVTLAVTLAGDGRVIGTSRYYATDDTPPALSIGYTFLMRDFWGGPTNWALKSLMLDHIFASRDEAWLHIDAKNMRSRQATGKLGAVLVKQAVYDFGNGAAEYLCYRLTRNAWHKAQGQ